MTRNVKRKTGGRGAAAATAAAVLAIAGCGDSGSSPDTTEPAVIPAKIASKLAERSDEVGTLIDTGNACDAAHKADELANEVEKAGDEIPAELRSQLEDAAAQLQNTVNCPRPPEPKPKKEKDKEKHGHDEGGKGGYGDAPLAGDGPGNSENAPGHQGD